MGSISRGRYEENGGLVSLFQDHGEVGTKLWSSRASKREDRNEPVRVFMSGTGTQADVEDPSREWWESSDLKGVDSVSSVFGKWVTKSIWNSDRGTLEIRNG